MNANPRLGKIARLPREIRQQLNERLADNEPQPRLLRWLNALPEVQAVLGDLFDGRPISQQNLSAWKLGGYREWERGQEARVRARDFLEEAAELHEEIGEDEENRSSLLDRVGDRMALALLQLFREAEDGEKGPSRTREMLEITRELARLRRGDQQRLRARVVQERWYDEREEAFTKQHMEDLEHRKWQVAAVMPEITAHLGEYLHGLAKGTLTPQREEWIRDYFAQNEVRFGLLGLGKMLPEGEKLEQAVQQVRENLRESMPAEPKKKARRPARKSTAASTKAEGPTSPHKAAPAATRQENFSEDLRGADREEDPAKGGSSVEQASASELQESASSLP
ncbi:MAG: hypothetical protein WDN28_18715 [Chthoniobacter sp.]